MSTEAGLSLLFLIAVAVTVVHSLPLDEDDGPPRLLQEGIASTTQKTDPNNGVWFNVGFTHAFIASLSVIVVSELGDKTFFIAAIMAMRHSRITVFAGAISALALMTVLSVLFGYAANLIPNTKKYTYYISSALFAVFGIKMLREGFKMSPNEGQEELEEVQANLRRKENEDVDIEQQAPKKCRFQIGSKSFLIVSRTLMQAFTMTFLAEWGDRSQLATIILGAKENAYGVALGGVLGHSLCTGLAVIGGRFIAQKISVRTVTIVGGIVFLMFALTSLMFDPDEVTSTTNQP